MPKVTISVLTAWLVALAGTAAALTPEQIAIVIRRADQQASVIARYYCDRRGVPRENIIVLEAPGGLEMSWSSYRSRVVLPLRAALQKREEGAIRCLLLVGQWPIRIVPDPQSASDKREVQTLRDHLPRLTIELFQQAWRLDQMSLGNVPPRPPEQLPGNIRNSWEAENYYYDALARSWVAVNNLPEDRRRPLLSQLVSVRKSVEGGLAQIDPEPRDRQSPDFNQRRANWQKSFDAEVRPALDKELGAIEGQPEPKAGRDNRRRKVFEHRGLIGLIRQIYFDLDELGGGARGSTPDSELVMLWRDNYRLHGSQRNPFLRGDEAKTAMMTARLDGFDRTLPIKLIDEAIAVEQAGRGVAGKLCIDAQGLPAPDPHNYDDRLVLDLESWKGRPQSMPLVKEASVAPISPAEANPVALYVGWGPTERFPGYTAARGAVAIVCSPNSAGEIHDPRSRQWCNGWLNAGAVAVVGLVDQGLPRDFVDFAAFSQALFVDGKPLAEAYWTSARTASWRTVLIGDPLYSPSAKPPETQPAR